MLAANTPLLPALDRKIFPDDPQKSPGSFKNLKNFADAHMPLLGQGLLTQAQFCVLIYLVKRADFKTGYCFPRRASIAQEIGIAPATVSKATTRLQELGIIAKFGRGGFSASCDYVVLFSIEAFALVALIQGGEFDRFRLRHRDKPLPINVEPDENNEASCHPETTESCNPRVTRSQQDKGRAAKNSEKYTPHSNALGPKAFRLYAVPQHWIDDAIQKRPDLDMPYVGRKFIAYHGKNGVRATTNWHGAWIRWVERENVALDKHSHLPPLNHAATSLATPPAKRSPPPIRLSSLLKPRVATSAPVMRTQTKEASQKASEASLTKSMEQCVPPIIISDAERERRLRELMASIEGKTLEDFKNNWEPE